jgi:PIN domain nuclease of toxin-antitoxin system
LRLLLDTPIWLWSKLEPKRLGPRVNNELSNVNNELWLSSGSVWEALVLMQKGRVRVENPFGWVKRAREQLREASLTAEMVELGLALGLPRADPADRFLAATAKILDLTLVTADENLLDLSEIVTLPNR